MDSAYGFHADGTTVPHPAMEKLPSPLPEHAPVMHPVREPSKRGGSHTASTHATGAVLEGRQSPKPVRPMSPKKTSHRGLTEEGDRGSQKKNSPRVLTADIGSFSSTSKGKGAPESHRAHVAPDWMSSVQARRYSELCEEWQETRELKAGDRQLISMMACVETELAKLQAFVNEHGPTYTVRTKSGDTMSRARPEYQQLQETRQRLSVLIDKMTNRGESTEGDADGFIAL